MRIPCAALLLAVTFAARGEPADDGQKWWEHIRFLAADDMRGRETGSPEHRRAAEYVASQLQALGLSPGAGSGFLQNVPFLVRTVEEESSGLAIVRGGTREPVTLGEEAYFSMRSEHAPEIEAPEKITRRSTVLRSSRTLPGQSCCMSSESPACSTGSFFLPFCAAKCAMK